MSQTNIIALKPFTEEDFSRLISWIDSPRTLAQWGNWRFKYPLDELQLKEYLQTTQEENPTRMAFKTILIKAPEVVGHIELDRINKENGTASVCRVFVAPLYRGQGIGVEMVREAVDIGFHQYGLRRIDLQVYEFNASAKACYEKVGFVKEGVLRKVRKVGDEYWNLVWMSILKDEWKNAMTKT